MPTPRRSDAPPSLEAANQAQINDLVRRNRTLEFTNKKLSEQISTETERSRDAVLEIQKQWHEHEKLMREECEAFLACYRFVQLRTVSELETERLNVLNEQKALRKEKLLRLQRDFRVTMFRAKERELEERIVELEDENERMAVERKELASALRKQLAVLIGQLRSKDGEIADMNSERDNIGKDISKLREENVHLQTTLSSTSSKLERINLQLEGAQSSRSELESLNDELKRKNHDLQRQLDKWQRLETKGDVELDSLRKRKIELEVEVKELRDRLEKIGDERALEKEKKRVERIKETTLQWQETAEAYQTELENAKDELAALHKELEQLKSQPRHESPPKPSKPAAKSKKSPTVTDSEAETGAPRRGKPRRKKGTTAESDTESVQEVPAPVGKAAKKSRAMTPVIEEEESEVEVQPLLPRDAKGKDRAIEEENTKPKPKAKAVEVTDVEETTPTNKTQRKRKASEDSGAEFERPDKKAKTTTKPESGAKKFAPASIPDASEGHANGGSDPVQKPKKRKINLFAGVGSQSSQLAGFDFGLGLNGGLNIPTTLSPLKETEGPIPNRTISSSVMSGIGGLINRRMGGPR